MNQTFATYVYQFGSLLNVIIGLLAAIAIVVFFVGIIRFLFSVSCDAKRHTEGKALMGWGLVALFVLFALGGILNFFSNNIFGVTVSTGGVTQTP